jgi:hypothetical protein
MVGGWGTRSYFLGWLTELDDEQTATRWKVEWSHRAGKTALATWRGSRYDRKLVFMGCIGKGN